MHTSTIHPILKPELTTGHGLPSLSSGEPHSLHLLFCSLFPPLVSAHRFVLVLLRCRGRRSTRVVLSDFPTAHSFPGTAKRCAFSEASLLFHGVAPTGVLFALMLEGGREPSFSSRNPACGVPLLQHVLMLWGLKACHPVL